MKKKIFELPDGARFVWNGETYTKGRIVTVRGGGAFYLCKPDPVSADKPSLDRHFSANLDVEVPDNGR